MMGSANSGAGVKEETSTEGDGGGGDAATAAAPDASDPSADGAFVEGERSSPTMALSSTKPRFKKLNCERMNGDILSIILVGARIGMNGLGLIVC